MKRSFAALCFLFLLVGTARAQDNGQTFAKLWPVVNPFEASGQTIPGEELSCPAGTHPVNPSGYFSNLDVATGLIRQHACVDVNGRLTLQAENTSGAITGWTVDANNNFIPNTPTQSVGLSTAPILNLYFSGSIVGPLQPWSWNGIEGSCLGAQGTHDVLCIGGSTAAGYTTPGMRESINGGTYLKVPVESTTLESSNGTAVAAADGSGGLTNATAHVLSFVHECSDSSGSGTAQNCSTVPTFTPATGDTIIYATTTANTGDLTINVNASSPIHARKWQGSSTLAAGDLKANVPMLATYDGTFWEFYTIGNAPSGGSATLAPLAETGNYTSTSADFAPPSIITFTCTAACTYTVPASAPTSGGYVMVENNAAFPLTIARNGNTFDGAAANLTLYQNNGIVLTSAGGTAYVTQRGQAPIGCMTSCTWFPPFPTGMAVFGSFSTVAQSSNAPQLYRFSLTSINTVTTVAWAVSTASAGSTFDFGMYGNCSTTCSLIWHTGSQSGTSTGVASTTLGTPAVLLPGTYYYAFCASNSTVAFAGTDGFGSTNSGLSILSSATAPHTWGSDATDTCTAGVLPGSFTIANVTNTANDSSFPSVVVYN